MNRSVQPEILDSLPENHPDAVANRRDLRLINRIMGNGRWFRKTLPPLLRSGDRILELGAGRGDLGLELQPVLTTAGITSYTGLDFWSRPPVWRREWDWVQGDLLQFAQFGDFDVVIANLILHQFTDPQLTELGERLRTAGIRLLIANEPARRRIHQHQLKLLQPFGLHPVSRHDGHVSINAGFRDHELAHLLGFASPEWQVRSRSGFLGSHRTIAVRHPGFPA